MQINRGYCNIKLAYAQGRSGRARRAPPYVRSTSRASSAPAEGTTMQRNGIHHVTAIAGPARRNIDFYTRTLGLRLVKRTVNFDDPGTYHLYYGDETGTPGTILTFFPWPAGRTGRVGAGQV